MNNADTEMASYFASSSKLSSAGSCGFEAALKQYQSGELTAGIPDSPKKHDTHSEKAAKEFEVREHCLNGRWNTAWRLVEQYRLSNGLTRQQWETEVRLQIATCPRLNMLPF